VHRRLLYDTRHTKMRIHSSLGWGCGVVLFLAGHAAFAQTDLERATARDAAQAGREAYDAGQYDKAIDSLSRAEQLVHAPTHRRRPNGQDPYRQLHELRRQPAVRERQEHPVFSPVAPTTTRRPGCSLGSLFRHKLR
jgi:hypothetical protein